MHKMKLNNKPFNQIKEGEKIVELRIYDEKRRLLKENDLIEFTNRETLDKIKVKIVKLYKYPSFEELFKHFDKTDFGYKENEVASPKDMEEYYSVLQQKKYGVLAIKIKKI